MYRPKFIFMLPILNETSLLTFNKFKNCRLIRAYTIAKSRYDVELLKDVESDLADEKYKPRKHPGILKLTCIDLPDSLISAVDDVIKDHPKKALYEGASTLLNYLHSRHPPAEGEEIKGKRNFIKDKLLIEGKLPTLQSNPELTEDLIPQGECKKINKILKKAIYNWKPIEYDDYMSILYLTARLAPDFASLVKVFDEIKTRNIDFRPQTFFDFGSGVGSGLWALNHVWPQTCKEAYCVDPSSSMNSLAERLLKEGDPENQMVNGKINVYFRQFLPASSALQYDIVLSSRSLYEVGDLKARAMTADILWKKVKLGGFLIFIENNTGPSYKMLMEIRDFLLSINKLQIEKYPETPPMHVFSPCPHDLFCPRYFHKSERTCHFQVKYQSPLHPEAKNDSFCYFVLQKLERPSKTSWPRVVQPVLLRHNHIIVRTCTPNAEIEALIITKKKHGSQCYNLCKKTSWGDLLPVDLVPIKGDEICNDLIETGEEKEMCYSDKDNEEKI